MVQNALLGVVRRHHGIVLGPNGTQVSSGWPPGRPLGGPRVTKGRPRVDFGRPKGAKSGPKIDQIEVRNRES